jgi:hypothetical protein
MTKNETVLILQILAHKRYQFLSWNISKAHSGIDENPSLLLYLSAYNLQIHFSGRQSSGGILNQASRFEIIITISLWAIKYIFDA